MATFEILKFGRGDLGRPKWGPMQLAINVVDMWAIS